MARKQLGMVDDALLSRVDAEALRRGQTRRVFAERALEAALSEAEGGASPGRSVGPPVSSLGGVRQTASPRASVPASHRGSVSPSLERFKP